MKPIQIISQDLFDKIRSRFQNLEMGDETGAVTIDPVLARFFDFDYVQEGINLGRVSISLNDLGSLKVYYSQGITENQDDAATCSWYNFLKEMRFFAMRRLLRFDTRDIAKDNLDRNDFQHLAATQGPKEEETMNMNESRWSQKSSRRTSRAVNGTTEVIVRHAKPVEETYPGARSQRKNIKAIFIQNRDGERFKYPFIHPAGAFAMAQHVDHGGVPHDPAGKAIIRMSEQIAQLQEFQRQIRPASLHDDALGITERALAKLNELKSCVANLNKRKYYESWLAEFTETEEPMLGELDAVTMETYKQKFTQSTFNENLAELFPLIHSIMQEANKVDLEEYVSEGEGEHTVHCSQCGGEFKSDRPAGFSHCSDHAGMKNYDVDENGPVNEFDQFESWVEAVEQGKLTDDQISELKSALENLEASGQKLELGPDGQTAWEFFSSFGLDDSDLEDKLKSMADVDLETDPMQVLQIWARDNYPELLVALGMSGTAEPQTEPAPEPDQQPVAETLDSKSIMKEVARVVGSFYNRDNPDVGPFRSEESIALDVEKQISEKFGEAQGARARAIAEKFMQKLTQEWTQRHGTHLTDSNIEEDDLTELERPSGIMFLKFRTKKLPDREESIFAYGGFGTTPRDVNVSNAKIKPFLADDPAEVINRIKKLLKDRDFIGVEKLVLDIPNGLTKRLDPIVDYAERDERLELYTGDDSSDDDGKSGGKIQHFVNGKRVIHTKPQAQVAGSGRGVQSTGMVSVKAGADGLRLIKGLMSQNKLSRDTKVHGDEITMRKDDYKRMYNVLGSDKFQQLFTKMSSVTEERAWMHDPSLPPGLYVMPDGKEKPIGPLYTSDGKGPIKNPNSLAQHHPKLAQMVRMGRAESFYIQPEFAAANRAQAGELGEVAPKGWEGTVKAMKKHGDEIDNPWALAHWMKGKGYKSHKAEEAAEGEENTPDIDQILQHLSSAYHSMKKHADLYGDFSDIDRVYSSLRVPLMRGDYQAFIYSYGQMLRNYPDATNELANEMFADAGLDNQTATIDDFLEKVSGPDSREGLEEMANVLKLAGLKSK